MEFYGSQPPGTRARKSLRAMKRVKDTTAADGRPTANPILRMGRGSLLPVKKHTNSRNWQIIGAMPEVIEGPIEGG